MEKTLTIIKPDAIKRGLEGKILKMIQENRFEILALKKMKFNKEEAQQFYSIHSERVFFEKLCEVMSSGPIVCAILAKNDAIKLFRKLMGSTNPLDAEIGTIRRLYGISIDENSIHGSDSRENAEKEINLIFHPSEIFENRLTSK